MVQKRKPGGGRKPQGEFSGKTAAFTTRITPETRKALERDAQRSGRSLSQEIERQLRIAMRPKKTGLAVEKEHNQALAILIGNLSGAIESVTGQSWQQDRFAFEALRATVETLLIKLAPTGDVKTPGQIEMLIQKQPALGDLFRKPEAVGASCAFGLLDQLRTAPLEDRNDDYVYSLAWAREKLGLKGETR